MCISCVWNVYERHVADVSTWLCVCMPVRLLLKEPHADCERYAGSVTPQSPDAFPQFAPCGGRPRWRHSVEDGSTPAKELGVQCDGDHTHVSLVNGRAKRAEVYPDELCWRIVKGLLKQMQADGRIQSNGIGVNMAEEEYVSGSANLLLQVISLQVPSGFQHYNSTSL